MMTFSQKKVQFSSGQGLCAYDVRQGRGTVPVLYKQIVAHYRARCKGCVCVVYIM